MKILLLLLPLVGFVWSTQPTIETPSEKEQVIIYLGPRWGSKVLDVKTAADEETDGPENIRSSNENRPHTTTTTTTTTNSPVTDRSVPLDLSQRLFYANYIDSQFNRKTLDLSGLDLSGEDVKKILYNLNASVLSSVARLDLSHNRIWDLPKQVWPLQLEYSLRELQLDYNLLNIADPIDTRTTRFELNRLLSLKKLSLSHCSFSSALESMEFPPVESLDLSGNRLVEIPSGLATLAKLQHLDMSGNRLRYLGSSPLNSLTSLRTLNLSHNGMEQVWDNPLENLHSLDTLHLDHNRLSELPKLYEFTGSYQPRVEVSLVGNAFKCGCSFTNTLGTERLIVVDKSNVTCVDESGDEWSLDTAPANQCSPRLEAVREKWSATKKWFKDSRPDWSLFYRSLGWVLFGVTLAVFYAHRRVKKTPPPSLVPYNILDDRAVS